MTPRTLFIVILRIFGILIIKNLLVAIVQFVTTLVFLLQNVSMSETYGMFTLEFINVLFYLAIAYILIFKAGYLVTKFGLAKGIEEQQIQFSFDPSSFMRMALIITAAVILFHEIPEFIRLVYKRLQASESRLFMTEPLDWSPVVVSGIKIILALLIIGERKAILKLMEIPGKGPEEVELPRE